MDKKMTINLVICNKEGKELQDLSFLIGKNRE